MTEEPVVDLVLGIVLLFAGQKLFWIFVGAAGFMIGFNLIHSIAVISSESMRMLLGVLFGAGGVVLAIATQRFAVILAGMMTGGWLGYILSTPAATEVSGTGLAFAAAGALVGGMTLFIVFNPALIILTSMLGAVLIVTSLDQRPLYHDLIFIALVAVGCLIQAQLLDHKKSG